MSTAKPAVVVTDANVVINFIHMGLLADLPRLVGMSFVVTDVVYEEVSRPACQDRERIWISGMASLAALLAMGFLSMVSVRRS